MKYNCDDEFPEQNEIIDLNNITDNNIISLEETLEVDALDCSPLDSIVINCQSSGATSGMHNELDGIQGGTTTQKYHISKVQWDAIVAANNPSESNPFLTLADSTAVDWESLENKPNDGNFIYASPSIPQSEDIKFQHTGNRYLQYDGQGITLRNNDGSTSGSSILLGNNTLNFSGSAEFDSSVAVSGTVIARKLDVKGIDNRGFIYTDIDENQVPGQGGTQTTLAFVSDGHRFDFRYQPGNSSSIDRIRARTPNLQEELAYLSDITTALSNSGFVKLNPTLQQVGSIKVKGLINFQDDDGGHGLNLLNMAGNLNVELWNNGTGLRVSRGDHNTNTGFVEFNGGKLTLSETPTTATNLTQVLTRNPLNGTVEAIDGDYRYARLRSDNFFKGNQFIQGPDGGYPGATITPTTFGLQKDYAEDFRLLHSSAYTALEKLSGTFFKRLNFGTAVLSASYLIDLPNKSGTIALLSDISDAGYVDTTTTQTVGGSKTFSNNILVNSLRFGRTNTSTDNNIIIGGSLPLTSGGYENLAIGINTLSVNTTGFRNTAIGYRVLNANVTGSNNVGVGGFALSVSTADRNTAIGYDTMEFTTTGGNNTALGALALRTNTTGSLNVAIGSLADVSAGNLSNAIAIGYQTIVNASNKVQLGNTFITTLGVGETTFSNTNGAKTLTLPSTSGTIALLSDITGGGGSDPLKANLAGNNFFTGNQFIGSEPKVSFISDQIITVQNTGVASAAIQSDSVSVSKQSTNKQVRMTAEGIEFYAGSLRVGMLNYPPIVGNQTFTLPAGKTGTIALTSDIPVASQYYAKLEVNSEAFITAGTWSDRGVLIIFVDAQSGPITIHLPPPSAFQWDGSAGRIIEVIKTDSEYNDVTILPPGGYSINGQSQKVLAVPYQVARIVGLNSTFYNLVQ